MTFKKLSLVVLFIALCALDAHADPVQLTGGQVRVFDLCNDPVGRVELTGTDGFVLNGVSASKGCLVGDGFTFGFQHGFQSRLTFQGQNYNFFVGSLIVNGNTITGSVTAHDAPFVGNPLITLTFTGTGFRADSTLPNGDHLYVFNVTQTPEPASALLLLTGLSAAAGFARRRLKARAS